MNAEQDTKTIVLIADDTPANLGVLFTLLNDAGFEVLVAENGKTAFARARYARPSLILLDVLMPEMDGFETCALLKRHEDTRDIPVIFMTALSDTADKVKGFALGAVDYVTKPFQHEEVLARVATHVTLQKLKVKLQASEERLSHIFAGTMDAIITLDKNGCITLFNTAAERVFRLASTGAIGRVFRDFTSDELGKVLAEAMQASMRPSQQAAMWLPEGLSAVRADGERFPVEATLSRVEAGDQPLYTLILRDINERRKAELERRKLLGLNRVLQEDLRAAHQFEDLIGADTGIAHVMREIRQVAGTDATVLITGETGTGKELIARAIHSLSTRDDRPLVTLNCATIPENLVESEFFGHEKGAFTGALARKTGRFELADGGTIFLDEIGEFPLDLQPKLLRVLQEGTFERVGDPRTRKVDVRVIAATNRNLKAESQAGRFRPDLFYRLNVYPIHLPALRDRKDDIPLLAEYFVSKYAARFGRRIESIPRKVMTALQTYPWPGNVRELQHIIERAVIVTQGDALQFGDWLDPPEESSLDRPKPERLEEVERAHILAVLEETGWRVSGEKGAAQRLGLPPSTLESRMKKLGITRAP